LTLLFLSSCYRQADAIVVQPEPVAVAPQTVVVVRQPPIVVATQWQCVPPAARCRDQRTVEICQSGVWAARDCDEDCRVRHGDGWVSNGCAPAAAEPCQCVFDGGDDILDGVMESVEPIQLTPPPDQSHS